MCKFVHGWHMINLVCCSCLCCMCSQWRSHTQQLWVYSNVRNCVVCVLWPHSLIYTYSWVSINQINQSITWMSPAGNAASPWYMRQSSYSYNVHKQKKKYLEVCIHHPLLLILHAMMYTHFIALIRLFGIVPVPLPFLFPSRFPLPAFPVARIYANTGYVLKISAGILDRPDVTHM